jgi:hypothetical protein
MASAASKCRSRELFRRSIHGGGDFGVVERLLSIVRPIERLIEPPFGLSIVAVCRRQVTGS